MHVYHSASSSDTHTEGEEVQLHSLLTLLAKELNPFAQSSLPRFFTGDFNF
jgi:hypothetical protein